MKYFNIILVIFCIVSACKEKESQPAAAAETEKETAYIEVGAPFLGMEIQNQSEIGQVYDTLVVSDTLKTAFRAQVLEVCQAKGCWMRLQLPEEETVMVRFKDYGFFVPKDIAGKTVEVQGIAFISEVSEEERRHLAKDGGASEEEIAGIEGAEAAPGFEASGVRILQ
ncbi:DUF4920 domain-containing protein [Robiginitalea sp. IMCC44478]|uniref:DUF4920 domain-containing protein n=1 Tax=Robiginitalea sp. IMCC44478 TaxID=3459122 RepID=UPI0040414207